MEELAKEFDYKKFHYRQLMRDGKFCIYEFGDPDWESGRKFYDVIEVVIIPETTYANGITVPQHQSYPRERLWGKFGWTYTTLEDAKKKFKTLIK